MHVSTVVKAPGGGRVGPGGLRRRGRVDVKAQGAGVSAGLRGVFDGLSGMRSSAIRKMVLRRRVAGDEIPEIDVGEVDTASTLLETH